MPALWSPERRHLLAEEARALMPVARLREIPMITTVLDTDLKSAIRSIPDYPKPGIMFRDITTLIKDVVCQSPC